MRRLVAVLDVPWGLGAPVTVALDLDTELLLSAYLAGGGSLGSVFWVEVVAQGGAGVDATPHVLGRHEWGEGRMQFRPVFPFEAGLAYRASFDAGALQGSIGSDLRTVEFSLPGHVALEPTVVSQIYPSGDLLPENLLRFYVRFSKPMARGRAGYAISICGADGQPVEDVLYRAPVELWDASMQVLTVLLDPGRLKRGVGPHRALGPPLAAGGSYVLQVGAGMTDWQGRALGEGVGKRFTVSEAVRQRVEIEQWLLTAPASGGLEALIVTFPWALDWALLFDYIAVSTRDGRAVAGRVEIDRCERRWRLIPLMPWVAGGYCLMVDATLEDPCGNNLLAPFDRPIRAESDRDGDIATLSMPFDVF